MKYALLILITVLVGCSTPRRARPYNGAYEAIRERNIPNNKPRNIENMPYYDLTTHVCSSTPIFDYEGRILYYDTRCR